MQLWQARDLTSSLLSPRRTPAPSSSPAPLLKPCWRARSCERHADTLRVWAGGGCQHALRSSPRGERRSERSSPCDLCDAFFCSDTFRVERQTFCLVWAVDGDSGFVTIPIYSSQRKSVSHAEKWQICKVLAHEPSVPSVGVEHCLTGLFGFLFFFVRRIKLWQWGCCWMFPIC